MTECVFALSKCVPLHNCKSNSSKQDCFERETQSRLKLSQKRFICFLLSFTKLRNKVYRFGVDFARDASHNEDERQERCRRFGVFSSYLFAIRTHACASNMQQQVSEEQQYCICMPTSATRHAMYIHPIRIDMLITHLTDKRS